jgi:hypothetical protein
MSTFRGYPKANAGRGPCRISMASLHITHPFSWSKICLVRRQATDFSNPITGSPPPTFETAIDAIEGQSPTVERARARREAREQMLFGSQTRFASPEALFVCDGSCTYSEEPHPNVVSIVHLLLGESGFMFVTSSLYPPARTCKTHGKAPKAR